MFHYLVTDLQCECSPRLCVFVYRCAPLRLFQGVEARMRALLMLEARGCRESSNDDVERHEFGHWLYTHSVL
jgi:hypothetical protein